MQVKDEVLDTLRIKNAETIITDLNRANCYYNILLGGGSNYSSGPSAIDFLFDECISPTSLSESIQKTLIYFEDVPTLQAFQAHLREILPSHLKAQGRRIVESYFANRTTDTKSWVRAEFLSGKFCRIICTTEAFGMGMDIPDIARIFQWSLPKSVSSLIQRFGRAARGTNLPLQACCTLVISQDYYRITCEDEFSPTNDTQRNLAKNRPDLYHILRSKCIRQGFMQYLGVEDQFKPLMPGTGQCCSRCSQSDKVPGAIIGIDGLCNPEKEEERKAAFKIKRPPKAPARAIPIFLKHLKTWRDRITEASLQLQENEKPHCLFLPGGLIPDEALESVANHAHALLDETNTWSVDQVSSWYGFKSCRWVSNQLPWVLQYPIMSSVRDGWEEYERLEAERKKAVREEKARQMADLRAKQLSIRNQEGGGL